MRPSCWLLLPLALLLLAGCGQKGALYHPAEAVAAPSEIPDSPAPDATAPSELLPPSDF